MPSRRSKRPTHIRTNRPHTSNPPHNSRRSGKRPQMTSDNRPLPMPTGPNEPPQGTKKRRRNGERVRVTRACDWCKRYAHFLHMACCSGEPCADGGRATVGGRSNAMGRSHASTVSRRARTARSLPRMQGAGCPRSHWHLALGLDATRYQPRYQRGTCCPGGHNILRSCMTTMFRVTRVRRCRHTPRCPRKTHPSRLRRTYRATTSVPHRASPSC